MDNFNTLIKDIELLCNKIIRKSIPLAKLLLTQKIMLGHMYNEYNKKLVDLVSDAKLIQPELTRFVELILTVNATQDMFNSDVPFLAQVWYGDMYGVDGISALERLREELTATLDKCVFQYITEAN